MSLKKKIEAKSGWADLNTLLDKKIKNKQHGPQCGNGQVYLQCNQMLEYQATIKSNEEQVFLMRLENAYEKNVQKASQTLKTPNRQAGILAHLLYVFLLFCLPVYTSRKIP